MPFFICPNCGNRELSNDRTAGFSTRPKGCSKCGFGFVFELLDAGRGSFELTGLTDEDVIGRPVQEVLGLQWRQAGEGGESADLDGDGVTDPIEISLHWRVRSLGKK